ncbi:unnamed protein product [Scytosiphon promiscuus]
MCLLLRRTRVAWISNAAASAKFDSKQSAANMARRALSTSEPNSKGALCCAVVYVSDGRDHALLDTLADAASATAPRTAGLIRQFRDPQYHRTGFTIGGHPNAVARASIELSRRALAAIDLNRHEASHPRIGVVDHVSVHPLGDDASSKESARRVGFTIAAALGEEEGLPVLLYGDLKNGMRLAEVRRSTPYFAGGDLPATIDADLGPSEVDPSRGIATIGCTPLVTNYNLLLSTDDRRLAARVIRRLREKDGGLPWVEALTLEREDGTFEAACNLLRPKVTTPALVLRVAEEQAAALGIRILQHYETGLAEEEATLAIARLLSSGGREA